MNTNSVSQGSGQQASTQLPFKPPPTSRDLDRLQHHISLQQFGERLQKAANAAFPNVKLMRYNSVHVLLLFWEDEDPNLPVSIEVLELQDVFENIYHFPVEMWEIPSEGSHKRVNQKILDFVEQGGDSKDDLKIVYYGGHGMLSYNRQSCWASRPKGQDPSFRTVKWSGIQHVLEEAESDVLLLFDCCSSGIANTNVGNGVTELIGACGFNGSANPVGSHSFTHALITELRLLSARSAFTVGVLYNNILCRVQNWMPEGREMQKPPLHVVLTQNSRLPRSIQISATRFSAPFKEPAPPQLSSNQTFPTSLEDSPKMASKRRRMWDTAPSKPSSKRRRTKTSSPKYLLSPDPTPSSQSSQNSVTETVFEPNASGSSASSLCSQDDLGPRIALTIRLKETLAVSEASSNLFAEWMTMMPLLADHVKVEASFSSFSTLLIVSLTVPLWCYLEGHPAISLAGIIRLSNVVGNPPISAKIPSPKIVQNDSIPAASLKPTPSVLGWGENAEALIQLYKFDFSEKEAYFELSSAVKHTAFIPKRLYLEHTIGSAAPYKCSLCQVEGGSILEGLESLARHHIVHHSLNKQNMSSGPVSAQPTGSKAIYPGGNQEASRTSLATEATTKESGTIGENTTTLSLEDNYIGDSLLSGKHEENRNSIVNNGKALRTPRFITLNSPSSMSPRIPTNNCLESTHVGRPEKKTPKDTQRHGKQFFREIQSEGNYRLTSPITQFPPLEKPASAIENHPQSPEGLSPVTGISNLQPNPKIEQGPRSCMIDSDYSSHMRGSGTAATGVPNSSMKRYHSDESTTSSFSTLPDSAYVSWNTSSDSGYFSLPYDPLQSLTETRSSRSTPSILGWLPDTELLKLYTFVAPKGLEPHFQLRQEHKETRETPARVYLDLPKEVNKGQFSCQFPSTSCSERAPFQTFVDIERHYQNFHLFHEQRDQFFCDYISCARYRTPFTRKDYLRNHLKDYHKEDIGHAQGHRTLTKKAYAIVQKNWLDERHMNAKWWRCFKCLLRVDIATDGFECTCCKLGCDEERRKRINALIQSKGRVSMTHVANCNICQDTAWIRNDETGKWAACPECQHIESDDDIDEGLGG